MAKPTCVRTYAQDSIHYLRWPALMQSPFQGYIQNILILYLKLIHLYYIYIIIIYSACLYTIACLNVKRQVSSQLCPACASFPQPQVMAFSTALWDAFRSATQRASELRCNQAESLNCRSFIKSWICCDWQKKNNSRLEVKPPNTYGTAKDSFGGFPKCVIGHLFPSPADCQADARSDSFWGWTTAPVLLFRSETLKSQDLLKSAGLPACLIGSCCSCFCSWLVSACLF